MSKLIADIKRLYKHAAVIGFIVALICHFLPPDYRVVCDAVKQLCQGG